LTGWRRELSLASCTRKPGRPRPQTRRSRRSRQPSGPGPARPGM